MSLILNTEQPRYWKPVPSIVKKIADQIAENSRVLEIGPGNIPFSKATHFVDCNTTLPNSIVLDLDTEQLPYDTLEFDFVYSRHVLEDIQNPDYAFNELIRIARSGYIETPSPLVECTKNVDGTVYANLYCGYIHHRYLVWTESDTNTLCFLPKYPIIDKLDMKPLTEYSKYLNKDCYWNNYYQWSDDASTPPKIKMYKHGVNFNINLDYSNIIEHAIKESIRYTSKFFNH